MEYLEMRPKPKASPAHNHAAGRAPIKARSKKYREAAHAAVSGASVSITDALGNNVFSGTTNSSGQATAVLTEFRMYNSGSSAVQEMRTPDAVSTSASGCTTLSQKLGVASHSVGL